MDRKKLFILFGTYFGVVGILFGGIVRAADTATVAATIVIEYTTIDLVGFFSTQLLIRTIIVVSYLL